MRVDAFDYELPEELIAAEPLAERDASRMLVLGPAGLDDRRVVDLPSLAPEGCLVVVNDTRVIPARLLGHRKPTGGKVEIFLCERVSPSDARRRSSARAPSSISAPSPPSCAGAPRTA